MKKITSLALAGLMALSATAALTACGGNNDEPSFKVGMIALHDENSTYDANFIAAMKTACKNKGVEAVIKTGIPEGEKCYETASDLVDQGCKLVFADSFGHDAYMLKAAKEFTDVQFCHATGTMNAGAENYHNAFASIYEGRYLAGVAAGMKLKDMVETNTLPATAKKQEDGCYKIGYVGAYTYAEVISGYTSFFLGVQSVYPEVEMEVSFTGSWYDEKAEKEAAEMLISNGCALISQHADSMGAPSACEKAGVPDVSYNGSTANDCPNTYIVSSRINWVPYFEYIIDQVKAGKAIDTDWTGTLATDSVQLGEIGKIAAKGTAEKIEEVKKALTEGKLKVFDCSKFTIKGEHPTSILADIDGDFTPETNVVKTENGITYYAESTLRSAPYFDVTIDGITLLNTIF